MQIKLITNRQAEIVVPEYLYVSQDNYEIMPVGGLVKYYHYLYCDSATSCIVVIVSGKAQDGRPSIAISHLSRPQRFAKFFSEVENNFTGEICVFAHGANPPQPGTNSDGTPDYTALRNLGIVNEQKLLTIAGEDNFERYANMSDAGILAALSSTPDAEVPWFCDTIRQAAQYVKINL